MSLTHAGAQGHAPAGGRLRPDEPGLEERVLRVVNWIVSLLAIAASVLLVIALAARMSDGPLGPFPGGPLKKGPIAMRPVSDWTFAADVPLMQLQLLKPPRSRTTYLLVHDGKLYVPAGFLDVPIWKQWPEQAVADGRSILRIEGKRYGTRAVRVTDPDLYAALARIAGEKYGFGGGDGSGLDPETTWFFELQTR